MSIAQLTLNLTLYDDATFANFYAGRNQVIVDYLLKFMAGDAEPYVYLYGEKASGRSHLLQACCHAMHELGRSHSYLSLQEQRQFSPEILMGMENCDLVCLDDVDRICGHVAWEETLFYFYNRAQVSGTKLLIVGNNMPQQLPCQLADLRSRLAAGLVFNLERLTDDDKRAVLKLRAARRGMQLSDHVCDYLMHHFSRDMSALFIALNKLDQTSLRLQRRITIPLVKEALVMD